MSCPYGLCCVMFSCTPRPLTLPTGEGLGGASLFFHAGLGWGLSFPQRFPEAQSEEHAGAGEAEGEREPHSGQAHAEEKAEEVAGGQRDNEIGDEGIEHHGLYIGNAAKGIGIVALHAVAKLVKDKRHCKLRHKEHHGGIVGEWQGKVAAHGEDEQRGEGGHDENEVETGRCGAPDVDSVAGTVVVAHLDGDGGGHAVVDHEAKLPHGAHYLVRGKGFGAKPAHHDGGKAEGGGFHAHLRGDGKTQAVELLLPCLVYRTRKEAACIDAVALCPEDNHEHDGKHGHARCEG